MQIMGRFGDAATPPPPEPGAPPDQLADVLRAMRLRYRRIHLQRVAGFWWYRILLVVLGGCIGAILGEVAMLQPKAVVAGLAVPALIFWMVRRLEVGLVVLGMLAAPLVPSAITVKSLVLYPVEPALLLLLGTIAVLTAFHVRKFVWPSIWAIWPQIGFIALAIVSEIMIQVTWIPQVPKRLNSTPVLFSDLLGVAMYCVPLAIVVVTTACLTGRDHWILKVENAILILAAIVALIVCVEFKRIGADVYAFRYLDPTIFYMKLKAVAQYIALGAMIGYARALCASRWRTRLAYLALVVLYVAAVYFTLEKSRAIYMLIGLVVITLVYSRRLFATMCALSLLLIPVAISFVNKLEQGRSAGDVNRFIIWRDMLRVWSKRPLLGVGPGNVWPYDQIFTQLPLNLRNFNNTGLGVAHNGVLQVLAELGPLGVFLYYAFAVTIVIMAVRLYRRSRATEKRTDRTLALICLGLICGAVVTDPVSGIYFLPPAQIGGFNDLPVVFGMWIMFGCLIYKDQQWRTGLRRAKTALWQGKAAVKADLDVVAASQGYRL